MIFCENSWKNFWRIFFGNIHVYPYSYPYPFFEKSSDGLLEIAPGRTFRGFFEQA